MAKLEVDLHTAHAKLEISENAVKEAKELHAKEEAMHRDSHDQFNQTLIAQGTFVNERRTIADRLTAEEANLKLQMLERVEAHSKEQMDALEHRMRIKEKQQLEQVTMRVTKLAPAHVSQRIVQGEAAFTTNSVLSGALDSHTAKTQSALLIQSAARRRTAVKKTETLRKFRTSVVCELCAMFSLELWLLLC